MPSKWMEAYMKRKFEDHRKRIKEAKSTIDSSRPPEMPMTMRRESERRRQQRDIEKDNRLILDRLAIAMNSKNLDNELKVKPFTSYMELQRKKQLKKIQLENNRMLDRIQNTVPSYRHVEWELDAEKRVEYLRNMTEFPELFVPPGSSMKKTRITSAQGKLRHGNSQLSEQIANNSPFRSLEKDREEDTDFIPDPPRPLPMEQFGSEGSGNHHNIRKVDRPVVLPTIHFK